MDVLYTCEGAKFYAIIYQILWIVKSKLVLKITLNSEFWLNLILWHLP